MTAPTLATSVPVTSSPRFQPRLAAWLAALLVALVAPLFAPDSFYLHTGVTVAVTAIAVIGLMLIYRVGQLSMGHAALVGVGAYTSAILTTRLGLPFLASMVLSVAAVALCAVVLGWLILRIRGVYFVLITFAVGQVLGLMFLDLQTLTGGAVGLSGVPPPSFLGLRFQTPFAYYYLALACCAAVVVFASRLLASDTGRAFDAINSNLRLAEASGVPTLRFQILAFTIGSALAALSGVLSAHYTKFVTPGSYETAFMVSLIVMVVLGGRGSVAGAVIGAAFIVPLTDLLRDTKEWENIIYGLIVLLTLRFVPDGLSSLPRRARALLARRRGGTP